VLLHLGFTLPAALAAQDTTQAQEQAPATTQDTLTSPDSAIVPDPAAEAAAALTQRAEELSADVSTLWIEIDTLYQRFTQAQGEERLVLDGQIERRVAVLRPLLGELTAAVLEMDSAGLDPTGHRTVAADMLGNARRLVREELIAIGDRMLVLRAERSTIPLDERVANERRLTQESTDLDVHLRSLVNIAGFKASLGLDVAADYEYVDPLLITRADRLTSEAIVALDAVRALGQRLKDAGDESEAQPIRIELTAAQEQLHATTSGLASVVELLDLRGMETTEHKQVLIRATGRVTTDVLDVAVATGLVRQAWNSGMSWLFDHVPQMLFNIFMFLVIVFAFRVLSRIAGRIMERAIRKSENKVPELLKELGVRIVANMVFLLGILIGLSQLGIHVGPVLAGLGVAGFIVGFALQDTLSNFAAGMMILVYQPFDVGDVIEAAGVSGQVKQMSLVSTTILTFDHERLVVPNRQVWSGVIRNKTSEPRRRVDLTFEVGQRDQVARAEAIFRDVMSKHPLVIDDPPPEIRVNDLNDASVDFLVRPWVKTPDYWTVYWEITRLITDRFAAEGIAIPAPRREVHLTESSGVGASGA
jgi:small conductance mechanosensitive channel